MPRAGEEGYEDLMICPYDRSHEIRRGRFQFHLDKCRKNFPQREVVQCPYDSTHLISKVEQEFHTKEDCDSRSRALWDQQTYEVAGNTCPVRDLVPVNAGTVPDSAENWDDFEAPGSVLNTIKEQAEEKKIFRMLQCESKAKRKQFRENERLRHSNLQGVVEFQPAPSVSLDPPKYVPLKKPNKITNVPINVQDPQEAVATISKQFRTLDLNMKPSTSNYAGSETSSMCNGPPSTIKAPSCVASTSSAATQDSRPPTAMSSAISTSSRMSTAASIAESANRMRQAMQSDEVFCQVPIPGGRGRGARRKIVG